MMYYIGNIRTEEVMVMYNNDRFENIFITKGGRICMTDQLTDIDMELLENAVRLNAIYATLQCNFESDEAIRSAEINADVMMATLKEHRLMNDYAEFVKTQKAEEIRKSVRDKLNPKIIPRLYKRTAYYLLTNEHILSDDYQMMQNLRKRVDELGLKKDYVRFCKSDAARNIEDRMKVICDLQKQIRDNLSKM